MKFKIVLGVLLLLFGIMNFVFRVGSGHSLEIKDWNSIVTIIGPWTLIASGIIILNKPANASRNLLLYYFSKICLLLTIVTLISILYDFYINWRKNDIGLIWISLFTLVLLILVANEFIIFGGDHRGGRSKK